MKRIVIADNCPDTLDTLALLLRLWDYDTEAVRNGSALLDVIQDFRPHVVLTDVALAEIDAVDVARQVKVSALRPRPRFVAITACTHPDDRRRAFEAGFEFFLTKPVDPDLLHKLLEALTRAPAAAPRRPAHDGGALLRKPFLPVAAAQGPTPVLPGPRRWPLVGLTR